MPFAVLGGTNPFGLNKLRYFQASQAVLSKKHQYFGARLFRGDSALIAG